MDSLSNILGRKDLTPPQEISKLKAYIFENYGKEADIKLGPKGFTIIVSSSALASTLRLNLPEIKRQLSIKDQLMIRIR